MINSLQVEFEQEVKEMETLITLRFGLYRDPTEFADGTDGVEWDDGNVNEHEDDNVDDDNNDDDDEDEDENEDNNEKTSMARDQLEEELEKIWNIVRKHLYANQRQEMIRLV